jgi:hypothetical protein
LALPLLEVRGSGSPFVKLTTELVQRFREPPAYGGKEALRFRIALP